MLYASYIIIIVVIVIVIIIIIIIAKLFYWHVPYLYDTME